MTEDTFSLKSWAMEESLKAHLLAASSISFQEGQLHRERVKAMNGVVRQIDMMNRTELHRVLISMERKI